MIAELAQLEAEFDEATVVFGFGDGVFFEGSFEGVEFFEELGFVS